MHKSLGVAIVALAAGGAQAGVEVWTPYATDATFATAPSSMAFQPGTDFALSAGTLYRAARLPNLAPPAWAPMGTGFDDSGPLIASSSTLLARRGDWGWGASRDGGATWSWEGLPDAFGQATKPLVSTLTLDAVKTSAGFYTADWWGVAASADGVNWQRLRGTPGLSAAANAIAAVGSHLFVNESAFGASIYRSDDGGQSWLSVKSPDTNGQGAGWIENRGFTVIGQDLYAVFNRAIYKTGDLGVSWTQIDSSPLPAAGVYHLESVGSALFAFNNFAGAFETDDDGATWMARNQGLPGGAAKNTSIWSDGGTLFTSDGTFGEAQLLTMTPVPVPEPSGLALMLAGLLVVGAHRPLGRRCPR